MITSKNAPKSECHQVFSMHIKKNRVHPHLKAQTSALNALKPQKHQQNHLQKTSPDVQAPLRVTAVDLHHPAECGVPRNVRITRLGLPKKNEVPKKQQTESCYNKSRQGGPTRGLGVYACLFLIHSQGRKVRTNVRRTRCTPYDLEFFIVKIFHI